MTLSKKSVLNSLLAESKPGRRKAIDRVRLPSGPRPTTYQAPHTSLRSNRCSCGVCNTCEENARWERIFESKFADPDYYRRSAHILQGSPLGRL